MNSGIDYEQDCWPHFVRQLTELRVRVLVQSKLGAEALRVQSPTFDEGGVPAVAPEIGNAFQLLSDGDLQVMTRHRFVRGENFHLPDRPAVQLVSVDEKLSGAMRSWGARLIVRRRLRRGGVGGNGGHAVGESRQASEQLRQLRIDALGDVSVRPHQRCGIRVEESWLSTKHVGKRREISLKSGRANQTVHRGANAFHL